MKKIAFCSFLLLLCYASVRAQVNCSGYFIHFPDDHNTDICSQPTYPVSIFGTPVILGNDCDSIQIKYHDIPEDFNPSQYGECYEFFRQWTIYNPATYDATKPCTLVPNPAPEGPGLAVASTYGPVISAPGTSLPGWEPTVVKINFSDPAPTNYATFWSETANCYFYVQRFRVFDETEPEVISTATDTILYDDTPNDAYLWNHIYWSDPDTGDHNLRESPMDFEIIATDSCSSSNLFFNFRLFLDVDNDGAEETVITSYTIPIAGSVMFNNINTLGYSGGLIREFDIRPVPSNQKWYFSIQLDNLSGNSQKARIVWENHVGQTAPVQLPRGKHRIQWLVKDGCGNEKVYSFKLANTAPTADSLFSISGKVLNSCGAVMPDVLVSAGSASTLSNDNGAYTIENVAINNNTTVCATGFNPITTYADQITICDALQVSRHILGLEAYTSPFQMLASDVNGSGTITGLDIIKIRQMLMGFNDQGIEPALLFTWQYYAAALNFPNPNIPFSGTVMACYDIPQIQQSVINADFIGVKTGDADGSADGCGYTGAPLPMDFSIPDLSFEAGDTISFTVGTFVPVDAYQIALKAKGLQFWRPDPAFNLTSQVHITDSVALIANIDPLFPAELYLIAQEGGSLAGHLEATDHLYLHPTAYLDSCVTIAPILDFLPVSTRESAHIITMRHYPNPWRSQTSIEFNAPVSSDGVLQVTDATGRVVYNTSVNLQKGMNRFILKSDDFNASGLLFCKIMTPGAVFGGSCLKMD